MSGRGRGAVNNRSARGNQKRRKNPRRNQKGSSKRNLVSETKEPVSSLSRVSENFMPLFPPRTHKWLRYHTNVSLTSTAGALATYIFRANDLFDPDLTSTGHQPMGFDQMMVFYNHFAVDKCRITVQAQNNGTPTAHFGVRVDANSAAITNQDALIEFGGITYDSIDPKGVYGSVKTVKLGLDIAKIQGIPRKNITTDPQLRGDAATSPLEVTYIHISLWDPAANTVTALFDVTIDYGSWFMEPRDATESVPREITKMHDLHISGLDDEDVDSIPSVTTSYLGAPLVLPAPCRVPTCRYFGTDAPHHYCGSVQHMRTQMSRAVADHWNMISKPTDMISRIARKEALADMRREEKVSKPTSGG